jgi:RNA polymerase sigma factor (sigma-70 family)
MKLFIRGNTANLTDAELIIRYRQSGDKFFVGELFKRYSHLVFGVCLNYFRDKDESKDAVMQIFEKLFDSLKNHEVEYFPAWLGFVSRNYCISELRKEKTLSGREEEHKKDTLQEELHEPSVAKEQQAEKEASLESLKEAILLLKAEQKTCIELFYLEEKSYSDISEITGYTEKEVKSYIQNGKRNLKILLSNRKHESIPA